MKFKFIDHPFVKSNDLHIIWNEENILIDVFPREEFKVECENLPAKHYSYYHKRPVPMESTFIKTIGGNKATLTYENSEEENTEPNLFIPGQTIIIFTDDTRTSIKEIIWKDETGTTRNAAQSSWHHESVEVYSKLEEII